MKRYIRAYTEDVFCMSKITKEFAIPEIAPLIGEYVYFSESNSSHGPRIKFYGGTKQTSKTKDAPTLKFDNWGNCELELAPWMNRQNCPNAFDYKLLSKLEKFVVNYLPILLLVWFEHLDEAVALEYFHGNIALVRVLNSIDYELPVSIVSLQELDAYCRQHNLYKF